MYLELSQETSTRKLYTDELLLWEPDLRAVDTKAVDTKAVDARAVDTKAAISQKVNTMAAVSYHIINTYLYVHILIQCNVKH